MAEYRFLTTWLLEAPRERVWDAIYDSERWPEWWHGVLEAEKLEEGDATGVGQLGRYVWKSKLPYKLEFFVRDDEGREAPPARGRRRGRARRRRPLAPVRAGRGHRGPLRVERADTRAWMNLLTPVARPIFAVNHDYVMRNGGEGLAKLLGRAAAGHRLADRSTGRARLWLQSSAGWHSPIESAKLASQT